jgi:hypothetical protein
VRQGAVTERADLDLAGPARGLDVVVTCRPADFADGLHRARRLHADAEHVDRGIAR